MFEIKGILRKTSTTCLLVTHNQNEAFAIGDKIGVIQNGLISQWGEPKELFYQPVNRFVAGFVGEGTVLPGRLVDARRI